LELLGHHDLDTIKRVRVIWLCEMALAALDLNKGPRRSVQAFVLPSLRKSALAVRRLLGQSSY
jgi:hypothetical protein